MADTTPRARDDTAAVAAYAAANHLTAGEAAAEWPFGPERDREHWREVSQAAIAAAKPRWTERFGPVVACDHAELGDAYAADVASLTDQRNRVSDTADRLRAQARHLRDALERCRDAAGRSPAAVHTIASQALASNPAPEQAAPETPGYRQVRDALAVAVDALQHVRPCTDIKLVAMARETLAEIGRLTYDAEFTADAASLDTDLSDNAAAAGGHVAEQAIRDVVAEKFGDTIKRIADEETRRNLAEIENAVRANERNRIKGLFDEWITILMSEPNAHPPEAWIAAFADLISDKPQFKLAEVDPETPERAEFAAASLDIETLRREGAEAKLAEAVLMLGEIREYAQTWMAVAMRLSTPQTRAGADCGRKILDLIDADAPTDDDESPRPPRTAAGEGNEP
jgi:hypothetical protein